MVHMRSLKRVSMMLMILGVAACGGGGDAGTSPFVHAASAATAGTANLDLTISTPVLTAAGATLTATVKDATGAAKAGQSVTFGTVGGFDVFVQPAPAAPTATTTATTDALGMAAVALMPDPAASAPSGADSAWAFTAVDKVNLSKSVSFSRP